MRTTQYYARKLAKYFNDYFSAYEETAEYYPNPEENQWMFIIPELGLRITLTCDDGGTVSEERLRIQPREDEVSWLND